MLCSFARKFVLKFVLIHPAVLLASKVRVDVFLDFLPNYIMRCPLLACILKPILVFYFYYTNTTGLINNWLNGAVSTGFFAEKIKIGYNRD